MERYIDAARIVGRKNLDGRLAVRATAGLPFLLEPGMRVHFVPPAIDAPRTAVVEAVQDLSGNVAAVSVSGVSDAATAEMLAGSHMLLAASDVPSEVLSLRMQGEEHPLVGWRIVDETSGAAGEVASAEDQQTQVLLTVVLDGGDAAHLVPLVDEFVVDMDEGGRSMTLKLPGGMFDLCA